MFLYGKDGFEKKKERQRSYNLVEKKERESVYNCSKTGAVLKDADVVVIHDLFSLSSCYKLSF